MRSLAPPTAAWPTGTCTPSSSNNDSARTYQQQQRAPHRNEQQACSAAASSTATCAAPACAAAAAPAPAPPPPPAAAPLLCHARAHAAPLLCHALRQGPQPRALGSSAVEDERELSSVRSTSVLSQHRHHHQPPRAPSSSPSESPPLPRCWHDLPQPTKEPAPFEQPLVDGKELSSVRGNTSVQSTCRAGPAEPTSSSLPLASSRSLRTGKKKIREAPERRSGRGKRALRTGTGRMAPDRRRWWSTDEVSLRTRNWQSGRRPTA